MTTKTDPSFRIPVSFHLHGFTIPVSFDAKQTVEHDVIGSANYTDGHKIKLAPLSDKAGFSFISPQQQSQVFCHELVHMILKHMGETRLCNDERFVDLFGNLLYQALSTFRYAPPKKPHKGGKHGHR